MHNSQKLLIAGLAGCVLLCAAANTWAQSSDVTSIEVEWKASPHWTEVPEVPTAFSQPSPNAIEIVKPEPKAVPATLPIMLPAAPAQPAPMPILPQTPPAPAPIQPPAPAQPPASSQPNPVNLQLDGQTYTPSRVWASAEYLNWWLTGNHTPPLVNTAPIGTFGTPDNPQSHTLFGPDQTKYSEFDGLRFRLGLWLDPCATCGIDASFFGFGQNNQRFLASSNGDPGLFRPFFNTSTGGPDVQIVALQLPTGAPGAYDPILSGGVAVNNSTNFYGGDANFRKELCGDCCSRLDLIVGYRYMRLEDDTQIAENLVSTDPLQIAAPLGTRILVVDQFQTRNTFNGGQIGLFGERRWGNWFANIQGTIALGDTSQQVKISGATQIITPAGVSATYPGGLLALPSNIGTYNSNAFSVIPEVNANIGYQLTSHVRVFGGYSFLYWTNVVRSGNQIDLVVNPTLLPNNGPVTGVNRPVFTRNQSDFIAQGYNVGIELTW